MAAIVIEEKYYVGFFTSIIALICAYFFRSTRSPQITTTTKPTKEYTPPVIKPVGDDFVWDKTPAIKSLPFKNAAYKLTMGIRNLDPQDWLLVEPTYKKKLEIKRKIICNELPEYGKETRPSTLFTTEEAIPAINEFYQIVVQYMCDKYPKYFSKNDTHFTNSITGNVFPLKDDNPEKILEYLAATIEEDFIILLKDPRREHEENGTEYFFKAGIFAFAAGFDPKDRFNTPLSFIHHPIPGYKEKLKVLMNRFFLRLAPGQFVTRSNFSMQTHGKHYVDDQNKGHNMPEGAKQEALDYDLLDFEKQVHYRSERQTLTKLPKTDAILFTIRTYLHPLCEIKAEGPEVCERLIGAINGFPEDIAYYKRSAEWGPPVIRYLST